MIHNFRLHNSGKLTVTFEVITEIGKCFCIVSMEEKDKDGRPKCFVDDYEVLGIPYRANRLVKTDVQDKMFTEGIRRIGKVMEDICDNNGWNLWSY